MIESILFLVFSFVCLVLAFILDKTEDKVGFFISSPVFFFLAIFPVFFESGLGKSWQVYDDYKMTISSWVWLILIISTYPVSIFLSNIFKCKKPCNKFSQLTLNYDLERINFLYFLFGILSLVAFFINFSRVNFSVNLLFISPREYEKIFGMYWFINYIYFLHVPCLILLSLKCYLRSVNLFHYIFGLLVFSTVFFHGIKYTVFDAIFFPALFYTCLAGFNKLRLWFIVLCIGFIVFFSIFSFSVRGGYGDFDPLIIFTYILPNYFNLFYSLELNPFPYVAPYHMFFGFIPESIYDNFLLGGFILNPKYNMSTGFKELIEVFSFLCVIAFYTPSLIYLKLYKRDSILHVYFATFILFCFLMMFYSYYFGTKFKYIYYLMVFLIVDVYSKRRTHD